MEESDDEDEFENVSETKFVDMKKSIVMNCEFNIKFKRWEPLDIADKGSKLTISKDIYEVENKFKRNNRKPGFNRYKKY